MTCATTKERLAEYAYGDLSREETQALESHLSECADCREKASEIKSVLFLASRYNDIEPPPEAQDELRRELARERRKAGLRFSILRRPAPAYGAAAVVALFAVATGIGTRMEVSRLERMNSLLSDSLKILNSTPAGVADSITSLEVPPD
jgi:anti-sigma factor RsiW